MFSTNIMLSTNIYIDLFSWHLSNGVARNLTEGDSF